MKGKAWTPGHVTGFFEAHIKNDLITSGSRGAGINLKKGVKATVKIKEQSKTQINSPGVSKFAIKKLMEKIEKSYRINVDFEEAIPKGCGFGSSGAEILSSLLAIKDATKTPISLKEIIEIAHKVEVDKKTGLGDVVPQSVGGLVIRETEGGPGYCKIDKIPTKEKNLFFYVFGPIDTSKVLASKEKIKKINRIGKEKRKKLSKKPTLNNFFKYSKQFALETNLGSKKTLEILRKTNKRATMTMLGDGIFSMSPIDDVDSKRTFKTKISNEPIKILE